MKTTKMKEWARREVDLAKTWLSDEDPEAKKTMSEEYEAAYRSYCNFLDEFEKLKNVRIIKTVFTQLLHEENLSPIVDSEDDWTLTEGFDPAVGNENPEWSIYQCKRRSSLFKKVTYDRKTGEVDEITFRDIDRAACIDINKPDDICTSGIAHLILDEMIPIEFPYLPMEPIKIFIENFKYDEEHEGNFDTVGILYFRLPSGSVTAVKRFFKKDYDRQEIDDRDYWIEINQHEYFSRKGRMQEQMKNLKEG